MTHKSTIAPATTLLIYVCNIFKFTQKV